MGSLNGRLNKLSVGLFAGLVGPVFGYLSFYLITSSHRPFGDFNKMILQNSDTHSGVIAISLIFNLVFFFAALQKDWLYAGRGVILATLIYAPLVVFFKYG